MKSDYRLFSVSLIWLIIVFFVPAISAEEFFYPDQIKKGKELTGRVRDAATGEPVIGASVFLEGTTIGLLQTFMAITLLLILEAAILL